MVAGAGGIRILWYRLFLCQAFAESRRFGDQHQLFNRTGDRYRQLSTGYWKACPTRSTAENRAKNTQLDGHPFPCRLLPLLLVVPVYDEIKKPSIAERL